MFSWPDTFAYKCSLFVQFLRHAWPVFVLQLCGRPKVLARQRAWVLSSRAGAVFDACLGSSVKARMESADAEFAWHAPSSVGRGFAGGTMMNSHGWHHVWSLSGLVCAVSPRVRMMSSRGKRHVRRQCGIGCGCADGEDDEFHPSRLSGG